MLRSESELMPKHSFAHAEDNVVGPEMSVLVLGDGRRDERNPDTDR